MTGVGIQKALLAVPPEYVQRVPLPAVLRRPRRVESPPTSAVRSCADRNRLTAVRLPKPEAAREVSARFGSVSTSAGVQRNALRAAV